MGDRVGTDGATADGIRGAKGRALQRRAAGVRQLTASKRATFLEALAGSCNVQRSAGEAGATEGAFYKLRARDAGFAAAWEAALATGYARLEAELLAAALGAEAPAEDGRPPIDRELAMRMLGRRDARARSDYPGGYGRRVRTRHVPMAEVEAALRRQLELLARRLGEPR